MASSRATRRVLFLDDDHSLILSDLSRLSELDIEIDLYKRADEALNVYRANPRLYDLVVVDLMLEGIWGDEFAARLRELNPDQRIVIWTEELGPLSIGSRFDPREPVRLKPK